MMIKLKTYNQEYYIKNREARLRSSRLRALKVKFGITEEQYNELLQKQDGRCFVCLKHFSEFKNRLAVDHNHKTREIRGLLCSLCNRYIIGRHTNPEYFQRAAVYLRQGTGWFVPIKQKKKRAKTYSRRTKR